MPRPRIEGLTPRRLSVLRAVVREYVETGRPVSSGTVQARHKMKASTATIRLDMAALCAMGFLRQAHRSGGRIPTASGYRAYVQHLRGPRLGPRDQVLLRSQLRKAQDLTEAVAITTRALADLTKLAALAIPPIVPKLRLLSIRLRQISRRVVLLAYTLSDGRRGEALVELDAAVRDEQARSWAQALEKIEPIAVEKLSAINCPAVVPERVWQVIVEHVLSRVGAVTILQGISHLAARPEFSNPTRLADVLALLDDRGKAYSLLTRVIPERGAKALIDAADTGGHLPQCALIVGCFGLAGCRSGRVATLGPMRMHYERTIAATGEAAKLLDEAWAAHYGATEE